MTNFASNILAALVAIVITATSLTAITQVPGQDSTGPQLAIAASSVLA